MRRGGARAAVVSRLGVAALLATTWGTAPLTARAQSDVAGTPPCLEGETCVGGGADPGPLPLVLPAGARAVALGGAFWTSGDEAGAIFHHPSLMSGNGFGASYQRFGAPETIGPVDSFWTMSGSAEWMGGVAGVGLAFMEYAAAGGAPWHWPKNATDLGHFTSRNAASAYVAAAGFAREIAGFAVGGAVKAVGMRVADARDMVGAVDLGASTEVGPATVALTVQNLGPTLRLGSEGHEVPLARRATLGAGAGRAPLGPLDVGGAVRVTRNENGKYLVGGGVEVAWWPLVRRVFLARVGFARTPSADLLDERFYELAFGGGFAGDRIRLDYAYQRHGPQDGVHHPLVVSHTFGLSFR